MVSDALRRVGRCCLPAVDRLCVPLATHHGLTRASFTLLTLALLSAKVIHLHAHSRALTLAQFAVWGLTFFLQDLVVVLAARLVMQPFKAPWARVLSTLVSLPFCLCVTFMAVSNVSFYVVTGAEVHWAKAGSFKLDAEAIRTLLSGGTAFLVFLLILLVATYFASTFVYATVGEFLRVVSASFAPVVVLIARGCQFCGLCRRSRSPSRRHAVDSEAYGLIASDDDHDHDAADNKNYHDDVEEDEMAELNGNGRNASRSSFALDDEDGLVVQNGGGGDHHHHHRFSPSSFEKPRPRRITLTRRLAVWLPLVLLVILRLVRPHDPAYLFLSITLLVSPFFHGAAGPHVVNAGALTGDYAWLQGLTSLDSTPPFDFLPAGGDPLPGFEDWYASGVGGVGDGLHYSANQDPLHISNLHNELLEELRAPLEKGNVPIKHIFFLKLESTRADLFPLRNNSYFWDEIIKPSYDNGEVPHDVKQRIANLTRTAESVTGLSSDFEGADLPPGRRPHPYGGLSANNAYTTGTYTLKSMVGSYCGVSPLAVDFNREYEFPVYQPCLTHALEALNQQPDVAAGTPDPKNYRTWPWHSIWMQAVTTGYDNQAPLMPAMGYNDVVSRQSMEAEGKESVSHEAEEVNYYGYPDEIIGPYMADAIDKAKQNNERLFISHLTGTTHHPWGIPGGEYEEMIGNSWRGRNREINHYLNSIGYGDRWVGDILDILEQKGVANETLVVMAGDHGLSLPNDGGVTPYDGPHVANFHVPVVLAHPHLPAIQIPDPVTSISLVPTILDLLIESSSLADASADVAKQLRDMYEGQSLIRPLVPEQEVEVPVAVPSGTPGDEDQEDEEADKEGENKDGNQKRDEGILVPGGKRLLKKQDWQFSVMNTGGSWLAMRSAAKPSWRLVVPLIDDLEWRFTDLDTDPYEAEPIMEFNLERLAAKMKKTHERGEELAQWLADASQVSQWWMEDNWKRWQYQGE